MSARSAKTNAQVRKDGAVTLYGICGLKAACPSLLVPEVELYVNARHGAQ